jgi:hypothetical protein
VVGGQPPTTRNRARLSPICPRGFARLRFDFRHPLVANFIAFRGRCAVDSYDPRWGDDPRDRDENSRDMSRGSRGGSDPRDRERVDPRDVFMEHIRAFFIGL